jgi:hypothetical protein
MFIIIIIIIIIIICAGTQKWVITYALSLQYLRSKDFA